MNAPRTALNKATFKLCCSWNRVCHATCLKSSSPFHWSTVIWSWSFVFGSKV